MVHIFFKKYNFKSKYMPAFQFLYIFISSKMTFTMSFTETQAKIN